MTSLHYLLVQFRSNYLLISLILAVSAILVGAMLFLHFWKGIPIAKLTRDPIAIGGLPVYTGFLSQIGIFFWSASATVCFFSAKVLLRHADLHKLKRFLLISALLSLFLGFDDVFLLHEAVFPYHFGIPEKFVYGSYAGFVIFYLFRFYPLILETEFVLLAIALFFFGISVTLDLLPLPFIDPFLLEDGAKLIGIVSWLAYFFQVGKYSVTLNAAQKSTSPDYYSAGAPQQKVRDIRL